jgi:hypothetical protein
MFLMKMPRPAWLVAAVLMCNLGFGQAPAKKAAFDPKWDSAVPYTILLSGDGKVLYKQLGSVDLLELKRTILANLPSDYKGFNQYWKNN